MLGENQSRKRKDPPSFKDSHSSIGHRRSASRSLLRGIRQPNSSTSSTGFKYPQKHPQNSKQDLVYKRNQMIDKLRLQLEYYWSDANLSRDSFFIERLSRDADCWLTPEELQLFPIVKNMKATKDDIIEAAKSSDFFTIKQIGKIDDGKMTCDILIDRNWDVYPPRDTVDNLANNQTDIERTLYIENLPLFVDREELKKVLELPLPDKAFLSVQHISIPRHSRTGERQGYAFAEYSTAEQMREACKRLNRAWPEQWPARKDLKRIRCMTYKRWLALREELRSVSTTRKGFGYCDQVKQIIQETLHSQNEILEGNRLRHFSPVKAHINIKATEIKSEVFSDAWNGHDDSQMDEEEDDELSAEQYEYMDDEEGSFAETSLAERRRKNPGTIRQDSVIRFTGIPLNISKLKLRVYLSHFAASIQHLDFTEGKTECHVRFANKNSRDFFLLDFQAVDLPLNGCKVHAHPLSSEEFEDYFENVREQRRALMIAGRGNGLITNLTAQDPAEIFPSNPRRRKSFLDTKYTRTTTLKVRKDWTKKQGNDWTQENGFTDVVAGNGRWAAAGTSEAFHRQFDRLNAKENMHPVEGYKVTGSRSPERMRHMTQSLPISSGLLSSINPLNNSQTSLDTLIEPIDDGYHAFTQSLSSDLAEEPPTFIQDIEQ